MINLTLPFPPTVNHMWGFAGKRKYLKKEAHEFRRIVQEAAVAAKAKISGRIAIFIALYPPTKRKFDIDNRIKALQDALEHAGVYLDDEQIDTIICVRREVVSGGMCKVILVDNNQTDQLIGQL
jgi:crossover junction endodeoxyribonuclease RusA